MSNQQKGNRDSQPLTLTPQEIQGIVVFLNRVDLKGNESDAHAALKHKLLLMGQQQSERAQDLPPNVAELDGMQGKEG